MAPRTARRSSFTMLTLERTPAPAKGRLWIRDPESRYLALVVTPSGSRSWYVYKKVNDKPRKIRLGDFPSLTIDDARRLADKQLGKIADGIDPARERRELRQKVRQESTLGDLWSAFLEDYAKIRKRTWKQDERRYNLHLKPWASRQLSEITREDAHRLHARIGKTAPFEANRVAALLSKLYGYAIKLGWDGLTPTRGIEKFDEPSRGRFLNVDEHRALLDSIEAEEHLDTKHALMLLLATSQRTTEVLGMKWPEIDLEASLWTIPKGRHKGKRGQVVHLTPEARNVLAERRRIAPTNAVHVFPGRKEGEPLTEIKRQWNAIRERAGLKDIRKHDLRRTFATWSLNAGTDIYVVSKILGHKDIKTTEVYAKLLTESLRGPMDATSARLLAPRVAIP